MPETEIDELAEFNGIKPKVLLKDGETKEVKSDSSHGTKYTIKRTYDHFYCTCPGWRNNGGPVNARTCKHLKALLGEEYEWERIEDKNPGVQAPLKGKGKGRAKATTAAEKKKKATVTGGVRDRKRKVEDEDEEEEEDDDEEEEEAPAPRGKTAKRSKVKKEDEDEDEEMTFSDLDTMDQDQLESEKFMIQKRMELINTLLSEASAGTKGKGKAVAKPKRTIAGKASRGKKAKDDDDEEEEEDDDDEDDEDLNDAPQPPNSKLRPQLLLAEKWDLEKGIDPTGWWMSEKLDGVRAYWNGSQFQSREGNKFHAPDWFIKKFPKDMTLDGELTCGRGKFIDTVSIVKTMNAPDKWKFSVEYHVFDIPSIGNQPFEERQEELKKLLGKLRIKWVKYVDQTEVEDKDHVLGELEKITKLGGEGLMLREPESEYIQKRSRTCLKVKTFHDAEAKIIGHEEGKGRNQGRCGALKCEMMDGTKKTFKVGTGLDDAMRKNPPKVGTVITYRYFELTKDGVPRFPSFMRVFKGH